MKKKKTSGRRVAEAVVCFCFCFLFRKDCLIFLKKVFVTHSIRVYGTIDVINMSHLSFLHFLFKFFSFLIGSSLHRHTVYSCIIKTTTWQEQERCRNSFRSSFSRRSAIFFEENRETFPNLDKKMLIIAEFNAFPMFLWIENDLFRKSGANILSKLTIILKKFQKFWGKLWKIF